MDEFSWKRRAAWLILLMIGWVLFMAIAADDSDVDLEREGRGNGACCAHRDG